MGKQSRMKQQKKQEIQSSPALKRAEIIMKVRCGLMTATQAAEVLGVSRKTYYKWEQRGLEALMQGLTDQAAGRPETAPEAVRETEFEKQVARLKRDNELLQKKMQLKDIAHQLQLKAEKDGAKKK